ncbi:hypothetical protein C8R44DRAFT_751343 [Mycena epipterygia]|nr:hypothetical protein C8R44DRAFT_751343 [Mycena epipterygia]
MSVSASPAVSDVLPNGPLHGHYSHEQQLYTVHSGSPAILRHTPMPEEAPPIDSNTKNPLFRQPRYLSLTYPYLIFIPTHYAWRDELFKVFDRPRHKLPIIKDADNGFTLHPDVAENWLQLEICLRAVGREMLRLAPQRMFQPHVNPWFFPSRFKFLRHFPNEQAARSAAWRSINYFLPLLGYVSMGLWCMQSWESDELAQGAAPPDWRSEICSNLKIHPTFLNYLEKSVVGHWGEERVGGLYRIPVPEEVPQSERSGRDELEWLLASIMHSNFPIPIYLSWGKLPKQISSYDVPYAFRELVPGADELEYLASSLGKRLVGKKLVFSRWAIDEMSGIWYRDPYTPAVADPVPFSAFPTDAESSPRHRGSSSTANPTPGLFPPLPPHSQQRKNETIQAFFIRRKEQNQKTMAAENKVDRQRRESREDNAKKSAVASSKSTVFFWEKQDGHYIRQAGGRGNYVDLWEEYPRPQRRFWPIQNEWDLCELFENNDPVFGEAFKPFHADDDDDDDDDDDGMGDHPTFPQNIDITSRLPRQDVPQNFDIPPQGDNMDVVETERPQYLEISRFDDMPGDDEDLDIDFGIDLTESDLPLRNLTTASEKCVNSLYVRFGLAPPRTDPPEYESCAGSLLDTLEMRFGFVKPQSPFVPRDPPQKFVAEELLANIVGMTDIGGQLASEEGLTRILGIFFGQCIEARSVNSIDHLLLDYHQPQRFDRGTPLFEIRRERLKSMRNPSEVADYYVVCKIGSGIGNEALLIPRATDLVELLRQRWGPEIKDVVQHFLARGLPFWHAYVSAEIMPACKTPAPSTQRPKGFKADTSSGLGFRPDQYKFDVYIAQRNLRLLHTPRGRIALQYGGVMARLARSEVSDDDFRGFNEDIYDVGDCLWDESSPHAYWHEKLSGHEIDLLCGVYHIGTGQKRIDKKGKGKQGHEPGGSQQVDTEQTGIVSWWPKPSAWVRGSLHGAWWTPQCEVEFFQKWLGHFDKGVYIPQHQNKWSRNLKYQKDVKKVWDGYEIVASGIAQSLVDIVQAPRLARLV